MVGLTISYKTADRCCCFSYYKARLLPLVQFRCSYFVFVKHLYLLYVCICEICFNCSLSIISSCLNVAKNQMKCVLLIFEGIFLHLQRCLITVTVFIDIISHY